MITILISIIGNVIKVTLEIDLNPNKFVIAVIAIKISITSSIWISGKYISTKLSAKTLIMKAEIVRKYTQNAMPKAFFKKLPPAYSQISIKSFPREEVKHFRSKIKHKHGNYKYIA